MNNEQISEQLLAAIKGIDDIKRGTEGIEQDVKNIKKDAEDIKKDITEIKIQVAKIDTKLSGIDTRLGNEESISRSVLGIVAGGSILALVKYLLFPS